MSRRRTTVSVRTWARIKKYDRATGRLKEVTDWAPNALHADGLDEFLGLIAGTSSKHLDATNTYWVLGNADPILAFTLKLNPVDVGPTPTTDTKGDPSYSMLWEFHDDSATARSNLNHGELWYKDPEGASDEYMVSHINGAWGNKPTDENWHWQVVLEAYSTNTKFVAAGLLQLLYLITGDVATHLDASNTWFRPFTSADSGLGSTGQNPDGAPTVDTVNNKLVFVWTIGTSTYNGAWDKAEVSLGSTYAGRQQIRYGGCKADGTACGTKASGETWTYTWELLLAQGS